jgi:polyhydroxyalkanoate synthase subunit PhaC
VSVGVVLLGIAVAAALLVLFTWAHLRYWVRCLTLPLEYVACEVLPTADGSRIELRRVPRATREGEALPPVLLVHGIGANHRNNDLHPDASLARYLAALGRDVWLVTLRSGLAGLSRREAAPRPSSTSPSRAFSGKEERCPPGAPSPSSPP